MQISRRRFARAKKGTKKFQAVFRGVQTRRLLAAIKVATYYRMYKSHRAYKILKSATIALQCKIRCIMAKRVVNGLKGEQKNIGKLRENNERLKMEMNSLKAMLAAQAKEDASNTAHSNELQAKQQEIKKLEDRVAELETQLAKEKAIIEKLEVELQNQKEQAAKDMAAVAQHRKQRSSVQVSPQRSTQLSPKAGKAPVAIDPSVGNGLQMPGPPSNYVSPDILAKHKKNLLRLEQELRSEKKLRRDADGEVIKLRAAINGVQLSDSEVKDLLVQKQKDGDQSLRYVLLGFLGQPQWCSNLYSFERDVCVLSKLPCVRMFIDAAFV